jgi:hypothetical protein
LCGKIWEMAIGMKFANIISSSDLVWLHTRYRSVSELAARGANQILAVADKCQDIKLKISTKEGGELARSFGKLV